MLCAHTSLRSIVPKKLTLSAFPSSLTLSRALSLASAKPARPNRKSRALSLFCKTSKAQSQVTRSVHVIFPSSTIFEL